MKNIRITLTPIVLYSLLSFLAFSCSKDESNHNGSDLEQLCDDPANAIIEEKDGLVSVEFEEAQFSSDWQLKNDGNDYSGKGYMVWTGNQFMSEPGNGLVSFKIKIENPGEYQFQWRTAVKTGTNGTEHNDSWLRIADASDFYAKKDGSTLYPKDSGKSPNPAGASKDGWFKIYRSGSDLDFKWEASTSDHDHHKIYALFDKTGIYTIEISARSSGHGIDKFILFKEISLESASQGALSVFSCN